jgi:hypothetical protein
MITWKKVLDIWKNLYKCIPCDLKKNYNFPKKFMEQLLLQSQEASVPQPNRGRLVKLFTDCECSSKIKKRKVQQLLELQSPEEISFVAKASL